MDPYRILGLSRDCSRDDVKAAFRARVWQAHPDRGGDEQAFIEFCAAYKQLIEEIPAVPGARRPPRPATSTRKPTRPQPQKTPRRAPPKKPNGRPARSPAPTWEPDLVLSADVGRDGQPAPPPDPEWQPDLVLGAEPLRERPPVQPADPNWNPELVLLEDTAQAASSESPDSYQSLVRQISAAAMRGTEEDWATQLIRLIGILIFAALVVGCVWFCWFAWTDEPDADARRAEWAKWRESSQRSETMSPSRR